MSQPQPIRGGDVYPASAADRHQARRERDRVVGQGHHGEQRGGGGGGGLHVAETDLPGGRRIVTASAGGQVRHHTYTHYTSRYCVRTLFIRSMEHGTRLSSRR